MFIIAKLSRVFTNMVATCRFRKFGPLRYARVTMDHEVGRSRGTGFVCFWKPEDATSVIEEAQRVKEVMGEAVGALNIYTSLYADLNCQA